MRKTLKVIIPPIILGGLALFIWYSRTSIFDYIRLYNYTPSTTIVSLANQDTMTSYARHLFYVYHPAIENATAFNHNCKVSDQAVVLGCTVIWQGIYLYNVTDPNLNGVEQVTAAYEMLHVGYSRLSPTERNKIDAMVLSAYNAAAATDSSIKAEVASYYATEGAAAVPNELHSVVGTEVANIPAALQQYYSQYFTNREAIINMANSYQSAFTQREQEVASDDTQLNSWQQEISSNEASLTAQDKQINQEEAQLESDKSSGNINAYNAGVPGYNSLVDSYNSLASATRSLIASYNSLVAERNSVAVSENQLVKSISSLPSSINTQ